MNNPDLSVEQVKAHVENLYEHCENTDEFFIRIALNHRLALVEHQRLAKHNRRIEAHRSSLLERVNKLEDYIYRLGIPFPEKAANDQPQS